MTTQTYREIMDDFVKGRSRPTQASLPLARPSTYQEHMREFVRGRTKDRQVSGQTVALGDLGYLEGIGNSLERMGWGLIRGTLGTLALAERWTVEPIYDLIAGPEGGPHDVLVNAGRRIQDIIEAIPVSLSTQNLEGFWDTVTNPHWLAENVPGALGQIGIQLAIVAATGGGSVPMLLRTMAALAPVAAMETGNTFFDSKRALEAKGVSGLKTDVLASSEALVVGAVNTALEILPFMRIVLGKNPLAKKAFYKAIVSKIPRLLTSVTEGAMLEGFEEIAQGAMQDVGKRLFRGDLDAFKDARTRWLLQGFLGAVGGGIFTGALDIQGRQYVNATKEIGRMLGRELTTREAVELRDELIKRHEEGLKAKDLQPPSEEEVKAETQGPFSRALFMKKVQPLFHLTDEQTVGLMAIADTFAVHWEKAHPEKGTWYEESIEDIKQVSEPVEKFFETLERLLAEGKGDEAQKVFLQTEDLFKLVAVADKLFPRTKVKSPIGPEIVAHSTGADPFMDFYPFSHFGTERAAEHRLLEYGGAGKKGRTILGFLNIEKPLNVIDRGVAASPLSVFEDIVYGLTGEAESYAGGDMLGMPVEKLNFDSKTEAKIMQFTTALAQKMMGLDISEAVTFNELNELLVKNLANSKNFALAKEMATRLPLAARSLVALNEMNEQFETIGETLREVFGYDGLSYINEVEDPGSQSYVIFSGSQFIALEHVTSKGLVPRGERVLLAKKAKVTKAAVSMSETGKAIIYAFRGADVSSILHELAHIWRPQLSTEVQSSILESLRETEWNERADEAFARSFERFIRTGTISDPGLKPAFVSLSKEMKKIYPQAKDIHPELRTKVRKFFDDLLVEGRGIEAEALEVAETQDLLLQEEEPLTPRKQAKDHVEAFSRRRGMRELVDEVSSLWDWSEALTKTPSGRSAIQVFDEMTVDRNVLMGRFEIKRRAALKALTRADKKWLSASPEGDFTNFRLAVEKGLKVPSASVAQWVELTNEVNDFFGALAESSGVLRKEGGETVPFRRALTPRLVRSFTEDAVYAMNFPQSPEGLAMRASLQRLNPEMTKSKIERAIKRTHEGAMTRRMGSLEFVRKIPVFPDFVSVAGKSVEFLETRVEALSRRGIYDQASRIVMIQHFGQDLLGKVSKTRMKNLARILGVLPTFKKADLVSRLRAHGFMDTGGKTVAQLRGVLKGLGLPTSVQAEEVMSVLRDHDISTITKVQEKKLRAFAKAVGGVRSKDEISELWPKLLERLETEYEDKYDAMERAVQAEGGSPKILQKLLALWQGIPTKTLGRSWLAKGTQFISDLVGTLQISLAGIPNLLQTFVVVPEVGIECFLKANAEYLAHPITTRERGASYGAYSLTETIYDDGFTLKGLSRGIRSVVGRLTLLKFLLDRNNTIAAESYRQKALAWQKTGILPKDEALAKNLRLTETEVSEINAGRLSERTMAKIVQVGTASTQYLTEAPYRTGRLQTEPWLKILFPYQSYVMGSFRSTLRAIRNVKSAYESKDGAQMLWTSKHLIALLIRYAGTGMVLHELRRILYRRRKEEEEDKPLWNKALTGALETQFFSPASRMLTTFNPRYIKSPDQLVIGMVPKIRAVVDVIALMYNTAAKTIGAEDATWGKYGRLKVTTQAGKVARRHFGALRMYLNWVNELAHPNRAIYAKAKSIIRKVYEPPVSGEFKLNPRYYDTRNYAMLLDPLSTKLAAAQYYKDQTVKGESMLKSVRGLRSSLMSARPLNMSQRLEVVLALTPEEQRSVLEADRFYLAIVNLVAPRI